MLNEILSQSVYFGVVLSLLGYFLGTFLQKKTKWIICNPMLIAIVVVIVCLQVFHIEYETYQISAKYLSYFMTPATVCLAVPLYKQIQILKNNMGIIFVSIGIGCVCHGLTIIFLGKFLSVDLVLISSLMSKSVTTPIALGITSEIGGITGITVLGTTIAGLLGGIFGPALLKLFGIKNEMAQGLAIGAASHAVGTSRMPELGEIQLAMSSLSIVVTGVLTTIMVPIFVQFL